MYSNKNEAPRRGRSFDSMNIGFDEKLLNNEVRTFTINKKKNNDKIKRWGGLFKMDHTP